jgi:hypothetical protein
MLSPPKISHIDSLSNKIHFLHFIPVFYLIQPSSKQIICFEFGKQNSVQPIVFYVPCLRVKAENENVKTMHNLQLIIVSGNEPLDTEGLTGYSDSLFLAIFVLKMKHCTL